MTKIIFPAIIAMALTLANGCTALSFLTKEKVTGPGPAVASTDASAPSTAPSPAPSPSASAFRTYEYALSPANIPDKPAPGMYSRREIESFLTASSAGFIERADVLSQQSLSIPTGEDYLYLKKTGQFRWFLVKYQDLDQNKKDLWGTHEINKWFEDRVTLVIKGQPAPADIETVKEFIRTGNEIIGKEKFVYDEKSEVGNIIMEFSLDPEPTDPLGYIGESACLEDYLGVVFFLENNKVRLQEYQAEFGGADRTALFIKYTPEEKNFGQKNRVIKIFIANISDRPTRDMVIIHELFHGLGLCGHSPYAESNLFPLPISVVDLKSASTSRPVGELGRRMIEMLYRPEILPGMTVKEAGDVLARLKNRENTGPGEIKSFLAQRKSELEDRKAGLLLKAKTQVEQEEEIQRILFPLSEKKEKLRKEIKRENKLPQSFIKDMAPALVIRLNKGLVMGKLKSLEEQAEKTRKQKKSPGKLKSLTLQIKLRKYDLYIYNEILKDVTEVESRIQQMERKEMLLNIKDEILNQQLRMVVRQLWAIQREMGKQ